MTQQAQRACSLHIAVDLVHSFHPCSRLVLHMLLLDLVSPLPPLFSNPRSAALLLSLPRLGRRHIGEYTTSDCSEIAPDTFQLHSAFLSAAHSQFRSHALMMGASTTDRPVSTTSNFLFATRPQSRPFHLAQRNLPPAFLSAARTQLRSRALVMSTSTTDRPISTTFSLPFCHPHTHSLARFARARFARVQSSPAHNLPHSPFLATTRS